MAEIDLAPFHDLIETRTGRDAPSHPQYERLRDLYEQGLRQKRTQRFVLADVREALDAHAEKPAAGW